MTSLRSDIARLHVFGSGGHAKVVVDAARLAGFDMITIHDDNPERHGAWFQGLEIEPPPAVPPRMENLLAFVAIGSNHARRIRSEDLLTQGWQFATIRHPSALVAAAARVAPGAFIAAGAVVGPDASVEESSIVNHNAVVDHDCIVGRFAHVAPGAVLGGACTVGEGTLVGAGAVVLPGLNIAGDCIIAGGAVVTTPLFEAGVYVGIPARLLKEKAR